MNLWISALTIQAGAECFTDALRLGMLHNSQQQAP